MTSDRFEPQGPVDWALGKVLLEAAFKPILYTVLPDRVDPRDWMRPEPLKLQWQPEPVPRATNGLPEERYSPATDAERPRVGGGSAACTSTESGRTDRRSSGGDVEDHWFDFVADTGDSDVAAYSLAYLFHGDLCVDEDAAEQLRLDEPKLTGVVPVKVEAGAGGERLLPRGRFLFLGGDTAYPVADSHTICQRFVVPTDYAFSRRFAGAAPPPRPLLGIPGNHDWYDNLDGFNRTFRVPGTSVVAPSSQTSSPQVPRGYYPLQQASYCALEMPGNWHLWALDARDGSDLDHRQRVHFEEQAQRLAAAAVAPSLLLATPNPAHVNGYAAPWLKELCDALPRSALSLTRLWFSGDTHHYARYDGVSIPGGVPVTCVVSGLGSAALHAPGAGSSKARRVYPAIEAGEGSVVGKLASPLHMLRRPGLRWAGGVFGLCLGAGAVSRANPTGEAVGSAEHVVEVVAGAEAPVPQGAVFLVSFLAVVALGRRLMTKPDEKRARGKSVAKRVASLMVPLALVILSLVLIAQGERSFGEVLLDVTFVLTVLVLLGLIPLLLATGQAKHRKSLARGAVLVLVGLLLGTATIGAAVVVSRYTDAALLRAGWTHGVANAARALAAPLAASALEAVLFPILAGFALVPAFLLDTQRAFISSFASIDRYAAFIRFRLRVDKRSQRGRLTGFVIAVKGGVTLESLRRSTPENAPVPTAEIVDVFTVGP